MTKLTVFFIVLIAFLIPSDIFCEIRVESEMDWGNGHFSITAYKLLEPGMSPSDHPRALAALEEELLPYVVSEIGRLAWNRDGILGQIMSRNPLLKTSVEKLAGTMKREWSRISADRNFVEAAYSLEFSEALPGAFGPAPFQFQADVPVGWIPVPEDGWTGIEIYVPKNLPVRGTGINADLVTALFPRILTQNLQILSDPASGTRKPFSYRILDNRKEAESLVGRRPFQVMARELYGDYPCDIILAGEDTDRLLASESGRNALGEGRIVILVDSLRE